jgi:hypothetical protein
MIEMSKEDLVSELIKQKNLIERMKKDYHEDMERKNKEINFLKSECKRVYDPIREFWNMEKNEEAEQMKKKLTAIESELRHIYDYSVGESEVQAGISNILSDHFKKA